VSFITRNDSGERRGGGQYDRECLEGLVFST
jgi:hypothetical protein